MQSGEKKRRGTQMRNEFENDTAAEELKITLGSGNVFSDLGLADSDDLLVKADLATIIIREVREHQWTQEDAAERLGVAQPDVSNIKRGRLENFTQQRLQNLVRRLGIDVQINLHRREDGGIGTLRVLEVA
jgi:predicted XRE-type DNA-binding protein